MSMASSVASDGAIGVFGGSFDPVHLGHLRAALELAFTFELDTVLLVPTGTPPHRQSAHVTAEHRVQMLELAVDSTRQLKIDLRELQREGKSYTFDTLHSLREELGERRPIIFGLGADAFAKIDSWYRYHELLSVAHLAVLSRPGSELPLEPTALHNAHWSRSAKELLNQPCGSLFRLDMTPLAISSTRIRQQISKGWSSRFLLPESVCEYIEINKLYQ